MQLLDQLNEVQRNLLNTGLVVFGLLILRGFGLRLVSRHVDDLPARFVWRQGINYLILLLASVILILLWFAWLQSAITFLSVAVAAIIIVNKEMLINVSAYPMVVWRTLFKVGDRIQIGTFRGDVVSINVFYTGIAEVGGEFSSEQPTGRILKMPNGMVLTNVIANYSRGLGLVWNELRLDLERDQDWQLVRSLGMEALAEVSQPITPEMHTDLRETGDEIMFLRAEPHILIRLAEKKVSLLLRYICKVQNRDESEQLIWNRLLPVLNDKGIFPLSKE